MSESVEEYLEAIYSFNEKGQLAKNLDLSERLKVSPPSVTQMIKKLADEDLVTYEPYKGVLLTGKGMASAQKVVRKHRLLERFLHDTLNLKIDKVHDEACKLEHSISDETAAALCDALKNPKNCPDDGKPIPACTLETNDCTECKSAREAEGGRFKLLTQLSHLRPGERARVAFVRGGGSATQRIMDMGLCPGTSLKVENAAPFNGPIQVSVRETSLALGRELAEKVFVEVENTVTEIPHPHGPHHIVEGKR
jgi:DtxR family transcriptional regulator, Mn-dependent transcriptional regulator